jgi:hypothetical protein
MADYVRQSTTRTAPDHAPVDAETRMIVGDSRVSHTGWRGRLETG